MVYLLDADTAAGAGHDLTVATAQAQPAADTLLPVQEFTCPVLRYSCLCANATIIDIIVHCISDQGLYQASGPKP